MTDDFSCFSYFCDLSEALVFPPLPRLRSGLKNPLEVVPLAYAQVTPFDVRLPPAPLPARRILGQGKGEIRETRQPHRTHARRTSLQI